MKASGLGRQPGYRPSKSGLFTCSFWAFWPMRRFVWPGRIGMAEGGDCGEQ